MGAKISGIERNSGISSSTSRHSVPTSRSLRLCVLLFVISAVVGWIPLTSTLRLAGANDEYTHILLALPVSFVIIYASWAAVRRYITIGYKQGITMFVISALIALVPILVAQRMASDLRLSLEMLALITCWIGIFVFNFGPAAARAVLFPLCFLYWMVPIPQFLLDAVVRWLQNGSAFCSQIFFGAAGVPVLRDDLLLTIPGLTIEVARECSSIRSSMLLLVTTMVLAQLFLRSPIRKAVVVAIAVPLSVAKNGLRIFTISMLGTRVNAGFLHGRLHRQGGIVFFLIALLVIAFFLWLLGRSEKQPLPNAAVGAIA